ncbi:MFS family permease [Bacillus horti]|uniref:MFS family permease n=2 Tax=Caldalkalibacillus horti TaxID=77523 RepID=A0ABT9VXG9_9BACI|nr:MFS family permease [Bacillus horti]
MAIVLFVMGILALLSRTAFSAMVPLIAGREKLLKAHTSLEAADALCTIIGPALGGYLLGKLGSSPTLMICGVLSITAMALISLVKNKHISASISHDVPPTPTIKLMNFIKNSNKGLKLLIANSPQLISLVVLCVLSFSTVFIPLTIIFHTDITLNLSAGEIGIILSSAGIGNLIGVLIMRWFKSINWLTFLSSLLIISSLGVFILFLNDSFYLMCLGMIIFDGALSMAFVSQITVHQGITPDQYLSRIRSVTFVVSGIFAMLGTFLAGFIPEIISSFFSLFLGFILLVIPGVFILKFKAISCKMNELQPIHVEEKE